MRISVWQQFSSNHSADFTVVGVFKSAEGANKAADEVRRILKAVQEWYRQPENAEVINAIGEYQARNGGSIPMPIEIEFGKDYDFAWDEQAPDMLWYQESQDVSQAVVVYEKCVIMESSLTGARTWSGATPMRRLLEKLGSTGYAYDAMTREIFWLRLKCTACDEDTATELQEAYEFVQDSAPGREALLQKMPDAFWFTGEVYRNGADLEFRIEEIIDLPDTLPAMVDYLQKQGCTDIRYEFHEGYPDK